MSQTQPATPSVSWRRRALRRTAGSLGAAVVLAGVGPAVANAAGADVANPVAIALRASGKTLASAFDADAETVAAPCVAPTGGTDGGTGQSAEPTAEPTAEVTAVPTAEVTAEPTAEVSAEPTDGTAVQPVGEVADPSAEPSLDAGPDATAAPDADVSAEPSAAPAEDCAEATPAASESPEAEESEAAEEGEHGQIVSTVAQCSPKGKDPLLDVAGAPANHGGYVKAAAHGDALTTPWGTFDLSTQAGADELCASFAAARAALPEDTATSTKEHGKGKKDKADRVRPDKAKKAKSHGKHASGGNAS